MLPLLLSATSLLFSLKKLQQTPCALFLNSLFS
jgi:hypothetical protein